MKRCIRLGTVLAWVACLSWFTPTSAFAHAGFAIADVSLQPGGVLVGYAVDAEGRPQANTPLEIRSSGQTVAQAQADATGRFQVNGLRGGVYEIATTSGTTPVRTWVAETAPPAARQSVLVNTAPVVRGELPFANNPTLGVWTAIGLSVAALTVAIVLPIALDDDDATP